MRLDEDGDLYWETSDNGKVPRYDNEPLATPDQMSSAAFWRIMPILEQI